MRAYSMLVAHGVLPMPGGLGAQAAAFVGAVQIADSERTLVENERLEQSRRNVPPPIILGPNGTPMKRLGTRVEPTPSPTGNLEAGFRG